jgi:hypothetical protein
MDENVREVLPEDTKVTVNNVDISFQFVQTSDDGAPYPTSKIYRMDFAGTYEDFEDFLKTITDNRVIEISATQWKGL